MPKVIIWRDGAIETEFDPGHRDWRLGRSETNDITLLDPRKSVSRFHAELREENGRWVFIDLSSQNGSWKDGQRVNRLVLEHGHEVLFGDYKLSFEDAREAPPPVPAPMPPSADITANVSAGMSTPVTPEQTLPVAPRGRSLATPEPEPVAAPAPAPVPIPVPVSAPVPSPVPAVPAANRAAPPRKGVNPAIIVLLLIVLLGALAAAAWKFLSSRTVEPRVVQSEAPVETPPAGPNDVAPAGPVQDPAATPAATDPEPTTPAVTPPTAESTPPVDAPVAPVPDPPSAPGTSVPPPATTPAGPPPPQTKRPPAPVAQDNPVVVSRYDAGRRALAAGRFAEAERAFQAVLARQPGFRDTAALLQRARAGQAAARDKALEEGAAFEAKGEWARAIATYERVGASEEAQAARSKMAEAGDDAYRKARQFDARDRLSEAITWYQRAVTWLPESDARKALAQERLAVLKGGGE